MGRHTARCATNKAKLEYRNCTRFARGVQQCHVIADRGRTPLITGHVLLRIMRAGGRETGRASACNHEERDMWTTLFSLALAAAVCFGVAAVALVCSKYLARLSG